VSGPPRVALVTGALGGIGCATIIALREIGYEVVGADLRDGADVVADVGTADGARRAVETVLDRHQRLDALVNAHGISGRRLGDGPVVECTLEGWEAVIHANLTSVFLLCKHAIPALIAAGGGSIVTVGSVLGLVGGDADFATHAYASSKAGVLGLTRAIAASYAGDGVRANLVAPGLIATPMSARAQTDAGIRSRLAELQPLTGDFGRPEDVASAVRYLVQAEFVTGIVMPVDGGWTVR
jgi:NAD(P)-dependent dehydrogenase (short-subunit alcohol dehydrogenase family)